MTEQEAIETLQDIHDVAECRIKNGDSRGVVYIPEENLDSFSIAIKALEEVQKYRSIGLTTLMIKDLIKSEKQAHKDAVHNAELLDEYREIGTVEECRAAVEKQKEMIAYCDENDCSDCPYHGGSQKENRCMNDFIADEIVKGGGVNE